MPVGNTPLARLIESELGSRSLAQVARQAGMPYSSLRYYHNRDRWKAKYIPDPDVLQFIADGLGISLVRVQRAAAASVEERAGTPHTEDPLTLEQQEVVLTMGPMTRRHQRLIADTLARIAEGL